MNKTILYLPEGEHDICATVNGRPGERRVRVSVACVPLLQRDLNEKLAAGKAHQAARPCGYFDHRTGPAAYHPLRFEWAPGRGVLLHVEWTQSGQNAVRGKDYSYVSPTFIMDRESGEVTGLPQGEEVGSLVNNPAFERIEAVAASRGSADDLPPRDVLARTVPLSYNESTMIEKIKQTLGLAPDATEEEVLSALTAAISKKTDSEEALAAAEKEKNQAFAERDAAKEDAQRKEEECKAARAQLTKLRDDSAASFVQDAIRAGKIAPRDEDSKKAWHDVYLANPDSARKAMETVSASSAFTPGTQGQTGTPKQASLEEVYGASYK